MAEDTAYRLAVISLAAAISRLEASVAEPTGDLPEVAVALASSGRELLEVLATGRFLKSE